MNVSIETFNHVGEPVKLCGYLIRRSRANAASVVSPTDVDELVNSSAGAESDEVLEQPLVAFAGVWRDRARHWLPDVVD